MTGSTPWNQSHVRRGVNGDKNTGFWNVNVVNAGEYEIRLRRWPNEIDLPIDAELPAGDPVPGVKAYRETPGKAILARKASLTIGDQMVKSEFDAGQKEVVFRMKLPAGKTRMEARFATQDGEEFGAYFAYVEKL